MKDCWCLDHKDALFVRQTNHNVNGETMSENHSINKEDSAPFDQPPIVCIGASAGGLDAFKEFFDHMPAETGIAFVLIPYLDPDHKSLMIEEIKSNGGLVIAQDPKTAKYEDMPQSAIETGMVDLIQPIKEMPDAILKFIVDPYICKDLDALNEVLDAIEAILESLPIGLGVNYVDSGEVTYLNEKFSEIYGWPKTDFPNIAKFFDNVVPDPKTRERLREKIMSNITSKDLARMVCEDLEITRKKAKKVKEILNP